MDQLLKVLERRFEHVKSGVYPEIGFQTGQPVGKVEVMLQFGDASSLGGETDIVQLKGRYYPKRNIAHTL